MGCLTAQLKKVNDYDISLVRGEGGIACEFERVGGMEASLERVGGATMTVTRKDTPKFRMGLVCGPSVGLPVLWCQDGMLLTMDGGNLYVRRR